MNSLEQTQNKLLVMAGTTSFGIPCSQEEVDAVLNSYGECSDVQKERIKNILSSKPTGQPFLSIAAKSVQILSVFSTAEIPSYSLEVLATIFQKSCKSDIPAIALTCTEWYSTIPLICKDQLKNTSSLSKQDLEIYHKRRQLENTPEGWGAFFVHCKSLTKFDFSCKKPGEDMSDFDGDKALLILNSAAAHCKNVTTLNFNNFEFSNLTMVCVSENYKGITDLYLYCAMRRLPTENFYKMLDNCSNIRNIDYGSNYLDYEIFCNICDKCPNLQMLNITDLFGHTVTDNWIVYLGAKCPKLTHLALPISRVTGVSLAALPNLFPNLQYINLPFGHYTDGDVFALKEAMPNLVVDRGVVPNFEMTQEQAEEAELARHNQPSDTDSDDDLPFNYYNEENGYDPDDYYADY